MAEYCEHSAHLGAKEVGVLVPNEVGERQRVEKHDLHTNELCLDRCSLSHNQGTKGHHTL